VANDIDLWEVFVNVVQSEFSFLEKDFSFTFKQEKRRSVLYENDKWQVGIFYNEGFQRDLDLGIRIAGSDPRKHPWVGPERLVSEIEPDALEGYLTPFPKALMRGLETEDRALTHFPSTPSDLEAEVRKLAGILKKYGSGLFSGDKSALKIFEIIWGPIERNPKKWWWPF
jgi:hypothetical protein